MSKFPLTNGKCSIVPDTSTATVAFEEKLSDAQAKNTKDVIPDYASPSYRLKFTRWIMQIRSRTLAR